MDERMLNELLECSVCLERLDTTSKLLPCQHTFCRKCLEEIVASHTELRCPECRVLVVFDISDLPPNLLLIRILEGIKINTASTPTNHSRTDNPSLIQSYEPIVYQKFLNSIGNNNTYLNKQMKETVPINRENVLRTEPKDVLVKNDTSLNIITQHQQQSEIASVHNEQTLPQAIALYDFESSDIGDRVLLHRRIDENWFVGECNNREGVFPINYVQMSVPIAHPQCIAQYDFEEEGCLAFKKGTTVNFIRRVDQNWAEGRIGAKIGIFPIAFVEMNSLAKHLMDSPTDHIASITVTSPQQVSPAQNNGILPASTNSSNRSNTGKSNHPGDTPFLPNEKTKTATQKHFKLSNPNKPSTNKINQRHKPMPELAPSNAFIALYAYKPQKSDELELKKGSIYYVKERCQDGWLKGINRAQKCGVFPGNYVMPVRKSIVSNENNTVDSVTYNCLDKSIVPNIPLRSSGSSLSMWSKPIGQHVEAFFGNNSSTTANLIKKITNIKRSPTPTYSMDNPVFEDNSEGTSNLFSISKRKTQVPPIHVRSGSCPSKLTQSENVLKVEAFGSHRIKPHKERSSLQGMSFGAVTSDSSYHRKSNSLDAATICGSSEMTNMSKRRFEKYKCVVSYPPNSDYELEMKVGDVVYVHKKRDSGWYKGTHAQTGKIGLFPSSFVEPIH